jgi:hypothetical protein
VLDTRLQASEVDRDVKAILTYSTSRWLRKACMALAQSVIRLGRFCAANHDNHLEAVFDNRFPAACPGHADVQSQIVEAVNK